MTEDDLRATSYALAALEARLDHYLATGDYLPASTNPYLTTTKE